MKEHKSNLKALEPVEIRLAAAVRIRHEIARLSRVEQVLDGDAREIALSVVGKPEVVDVVLGVIGAAFADDTDAFDQAAVEAFLAEHHDLRIGATVAMSPPSPEVEARRPAGASAGAAPAGGAVATPIVPNAPAAPVGQPAESASAQHDAEPSAAEAVAARLSAYEIVMPADYLGVSFDMVKRPEADLIMGEAILAVVDGLPLDASPYKGDRGKVHWRRKLFEETFAYFSAAPPRAKILATGTVEGAAVGTTVVEAPDDAIPPVHAGTLQAPVDAQLLAPADEPPADAVPSTGQPEATPEHAGGDEAHDPVDEGSAPVLEQDPGTPQAASDDEADPNGDAHGPVEGDRVEGAGDDRLPDDEVRHDAAEPPLVEPVLGNAGTGRVIDFPSPTAAPVAPVAPVAPAEPDLDHVDPFESSPPERRTASLGAVGPIDQGDPTDTPTYDGPEWEAPGSEAEEDLERNFADRAGFDRDDDDRYGAPATNPGLDHAAAAALAQAVDIPGAATIEAPRLPAGGVPPRPAMAMQSVRPVPAVPPRPAQATPGPAASGLPPARPALAGAGDGTRLAPRPVAVRPPGM